MTTSAGDRGLSDEDFEQLLEFRVAVRKFLKFSEEQASAHGITPNQHQLLLAIRGHRGGRGPTVGEVAECLLVRPHSAVELIDRAEAAGLVTRHADGDDQRIVRLRLTRAGAGRLERISRANLREIGRLSSGFREIWKAIERLSADR